MNGPRVPRTHLEALTLGWSREAGELLRAYRPVARSGKGARAEQVESEHVQGLIARAEALGRARGLLSAQRDLAHVLGEDEPGGVQLVGQLELGEDPGAGLPEVPAVPEPAPSSGWTPPPPPAPPAAPAGGARPAGGRRGRQTPGSGKRAQPRQPPQQPREQPEQPEQPASAPWEGSRLRDPLAKDWPSG